MTIHLLQYEQKCDSVISSKVKFCVDNIKTNFFAVSNICLLSYFLFRSVLISAPRFSLILVDGYLYMYVSHAKIKRRRGFCVCVCERESERKCVCVQKGMKKKNEKRGCRLQKNWAWDRKEEMQERGTHTRTHVKDRSDIRIETRPKLKSVTIRNGSSVSSVPIGGLMCNIHRLIHSLTFHSLSLLGLTNEWVKFNTT